MFVVRKLNRELPLRLCLQGQAGDVGRAKSEPRVFTRRRTHMADGANGWARANHHLAREELLAMAADAGIVIRKVGDIGKVSVRVVCSWNFVTSFARQAFVFIGGMKKRRVFCGRTARCLSLRSRWCCAGTAAGLGGNSGDQANSDD